MELGKTATGRVVKMPTSREFTPEFKAQVVLQVLQGTKGGEQVCSENGIEGSEFARGKSEFLQNATNAFRRAYKKPQ
jgi:transposase-like protein